MFLQTKSSNPPRVFVPYPAECPICLEDADGGDFFLSCDARRHHFCRTCVRRAADVAIGDGKTVLACLIGPQDDCEAAVPLTELQKALEVDTLNK